MNHLRLAVMGAGAMGSLFGGLLARSGAEVWLIDTWAEQVTALAGQGLSIEDATGTLGMDQVTIPVQATSDPTAPGPVDLVLFFVKSYHTRSAAETARPLIGRDTAVLTLQNGLGNTENLQAVFGRERVLAGTTACGATLLGPGRVRFAGRGPTVLGEPDGPPSERAAAVVRQLEAAGLPAQLSADIGSVIWAKVLVNVGINALTALTGLRNGQLLEYPETRALMRAAVDEAAAVAVAAGAVLPWDDPVAHVEHVARLTAANRSSMLQDMDHGRPTEIDAINGAVVAAGQRLGLPVEANRALTLLVKLDQKLRTSGQVDSPK